VNTGLSGRRAVVAAATSGLGYAVAEALLREGASVVVGGSDEERTATAAKRLGPSATGVAADLTSPEDSERFIRSARDILGGVDVLVANGPGPPAGTFGSTNFDAYEAALRANLLATIRMCYAAVPQMRKQGWGRVVAITSIAVREPIPSLILSNTARAGLTGFLKTLAREVAGDGVTVNSVQPGLHATERVTNVYGDQLSEELERIPARRLGNAGEFGEVVAFLCSDQASYITGVALPVDGGLHHGLQ